jgi:glutamate--cysteine ligase catalytic subunit
MNIKVRIILEQCLFTFIYFRKLISFIFQRFLNTNVNKRRQAKVSVNVPSNKKKRIFFKNLSIELVYKDLNTENPFKDDFSSYEVENWEKYVETREDNHIHLDSSSIGWGCCCLQVTFQAASFNESLQLYDQLIPLTPIFVS